MKSECNDVGDKEPLTKTNQVQENTGNFTQGAKVTYVYCIYIHTYIYIYSQKAFEAEGLPARRVTVNVRKGSVELVGKGRRQIKL